MSPPVYSDDQIGSVLLEQSVPPSWRIIPAHHMVTPLCTVAADSRFCSSADGYTVLYCAPDFATAFIETVVRDRLARRRRWELPAALQSHHISLIG